MPQNKANEAVIERLIRCINDRKIEIMDELFREDSIIDWPQSGEKVIGGKNRRGIYKSFPQLPKITPRNMISDGDLVVAEATLNYGTEQDYKTIFVFEFKDGKIAKETAYWSESFEAPAWRAQWVS